MALGIRGRHLGKLNSFQNKIFIYSHGVTRFLGIDFKISTNRVLEDKMETETTSENG